LSKRFIKETINGVTLEEIQAAAFKNIKRAYWTGGYVYLSTADLQSIAWGATQAVYEMKDEYVKKHKNVCGLACKIAYNDMMDYIKKENIRKDRFVPLERVDVDRGCWNVVDIETGRKVTYGGIAVDKGFDITADEGLQRINRVVESRLSEVEQEVYNMNVDGYSPKEVAQVCNVTYGNARKKWHDIKKKLNEDEYIHKRAKEMGLVA
jgi:DNA-directed RNA polymerase specialized sigma24 family protein